MFQAASRRTARMVTLLSSHVQPGVINAAGAALTLGGLLLTFIWLQYLYR
jgi:hypothetical protein